MTPDKIIITSVTIFIAIVIIGAIIFSNLKFTGSDAAGNGMEKGFTFFYGLAGLVCLGIIFTIVNAFFFNEITSIWIKFLFFVPILLPSAIFLITFFELDQPRRVSLDKQAHSLMFEIKTTEKLKNPKFLFKTSRGSSHSTLYYDKVEDGFHFYKVGKSIFYEAERKFHVSSDEYKTPNYHLKIPFKPKIIPFTNWEIFHTINQNSHDSISLEFRYEITRH